MGKPTFRQGLLSGIIFAALLALPLKVGAQAAARHSSQLSDRSAPEIQLAEFRPGELPDLPTGRSPDSTAVFGRDAFFRANSAAIPPAPVISASSTSGELTPHRFWDRENGVLFAAVAGTAVADFCVTNANLASGGKELNPVTRVFAGSTPALAANFALETTGVVALSYLFHKTGHHSLERATSFISIGGSSMAVAYDLRHR